MGIAVQALALVFVVVFVRALPWPKGWLDRKPLSCDACCVGWPLVFAASIELVLHGFARLHELGELAASGGGAVLLLTLKRYWAPLPPGA